LRKPLQKSRSVLLTLVVGVGLLTAACAQHAPQDTLKPAGPVARKIDGLFTFTFWFAVAVFILVEFGVVYLIWRYRHRDDRPEPVQVHGNTRLELTWTILPAIALVIVAFPTFKTIFDLARKPKDPIRVTVIGHQFWWEYRYTDLGVVAANELHMPTGRPVYLTLESADVIHSFWIPKLGGKHDVEPGRVSRITLTADKPGTYLGQCAEFCGLSHANMRLRGIAQNPGDFDTWVAAQRTSAAGPPAGTPAADGLTLFNAKGCSGCHTVEGVSTGQVGPNLTHVYSRQAFAGDTFDMTPDNLRMWLRDPPGVKPGSKMPNLGLSAAETSSLVAYLQTLR
jgi:cytochrome c oxidase subunit II